MVPLQTPGADHAAHDHPQGPTRSQGAQLGQIAADYLAGIKPLRLIAEEHGVSHTAIGKRARNEAWPRDLCGKIRAKADELVSKAAVSKEVSKERAVTEKNVIEVNAELQKQVRLSHRTDIGRAKTLLGNLLAEVKAQTNNVALFIQLGELMDKASDKRDLLNELYQKIVSTVGRVDSSKKLVEMLEKFIRMEREAFGIESGDGSVSDPLSDLIASFGRSAMPAPALNVVTRFSAETPQSVGLRRMRTTHSGTGTAWLGH